MFSDAEMYNENSILKILKWLSKTMATLHRVLKEYALQDQNCLSDAQLLVTLLRALGLRVRLVMVLSPISFKETKSSGKRKSVENNEKKVAMSGDKDGEEKIDLTVESAEGSSKETKSTGKRKRGGSCHGEARSKACRGKEGSDSGAGETVRTVKKKSCQSATGEGNSSSCTSGQGERETRRISQATKRQKRGSRGGTTSATSSPYFKKQAKRTRRSTSSSTSSTAIVEEETDPDNLEQSVIHQSCGSDSEYMPETVKPKRRSSRASLERTGDSGYNDRSDDNFQPPVKKRRRSSKLTRTSQAKKLKVAADKKAKTEAGKNSLKTSSRASMSRTKVSKSTVASDSEDGDPKIPLRTASLSETGNDTNPAGASNYGSNQSRGSSEGVEIVKSEETACWAEVYLTVAKGEDGATSRREGERVKEKGKRWRCVHMPSCSVGPASPL